MKKYFLHRESSGLKLSYEKELNKEQYAVVMHREGPMLVLVGAGTGKTRTVTYRVARLIETGIRPETILLGGRVGRDPRTVDGGGPPPLAATVEEGAGHPLARSLVAAARARGIEPGRAAAVQESPGRGVSGMADGRHVTVGSLSLIRERAPGAADALDHLRGGRTGLHAYVAVDGEAAGQVLFADQPRPGVREVLDRLRAQGLIRQVLLSGDHADTARSVGRADGLSEAEGDLLPADKVAFVQRLRREGLRVMMVGSRGRNSATIQ